MKARTKKKAGYSYDPRADGVSQTILADWMTCRQLCLLRHLRGLEPIGEPGYFGHGSISHGTIERGLRAIQAGEMSEVAGLQKQSPGWTNAAHQEWFKRGAHETRAADDAEESAAVLRQLLPVYWARWGAKDLATKWLKIEERFRAPVDLGRGLVVPLVGRYDAVFERNGRPALFETKNKGVWPEGLADVLPLDTQIGVYLTALSITEKTEARIAVYNVIRRPQERRKKDESALAFATRIAVRAREETDHFFLRLEIELQKTERERHVEHVRRLLQEFMCWFLESKARGYSDDPVWNGGACDGHYGTCRYVKICSRGDLTSYRQKPCPHPELQQ